MQWNVLHINPIVDHHWLVVTFCLALSETALLFAYMDSSTTVHKRRQSKVFDWQLIFSCVILDYVVYVLQTIVQLFFRRHIYSPLAVLDLVVFQQECELLHSERDLLQFLILILKLKKIIIIRILPSGTT